MVIVLFTPKQNILCIILDISRVALTSTLTVALLSWLDYYTVIGHKYQSMHVFVNIVQLLYQNIV